MLKPINQSFSPQFRVNMHRSLEMRNDFIVLIGDRHFVNSDGSSAVDFCRYCGKDIANFALSNVRDGSFNAYGSISARIGSESQG